MLVGCRTGGVWMSQVDTTEALSIELHHFLDCMRNGKPPSAMVTARGQASAGNLRIAEENGEVVRLRLRL